MLEPVRVPLRGRAFASLLVALVASLSSFVALASTVVPAAGAQPGSTVAPSGAIPVPFPGEVVAPIPSLSRQPGPDVPELTMTDVYVAPSIDVDEPDVVVQFAEPFTLPNATYSVSVLVGDPRGERLRASLRSTDPKVDPIGIAERYDGESWQDAGPITVSFNPQGAAVIRVPHTTAPAGDAVWVELNEGNMATATRTSPYYSRAAFFHTAVEGTLPTSAVGRVNEPNGNFTRDVVALPEPSVLAVDDGVISLVPGELATTLLDQPVQRATETIRIAEGYQPGQVRGAGIVIDWTARTISLIDERGPDPQDRSGDRAWIRTGFPATAPGTIAAPADPAATVVPVQLSFDLATIVRAFGLEGDPITMAFGAGRTYELADGRVVAGDGVLATTEWFDRRPVVLPDLEVPGGDDPAPGVAVDDASTSGAVVGVIAAALVLAALVVFVVARRRRSPAVVVTEAPESGDPPTGEDRVPWVRQDGTRTATAEMEHVRLATGSVPVVVIEEPAGAEEADPIAVDPVAEDPVAEDPVDLTAPEPPEPELDLVAVTEPAGDDGPTEPSERDPGVDPADVLAALDLDVEEFKARLARD